MGYLIYVVIKIKHFGEKEMNLATKLFRSILITLIINFAHGQQPLQKSELGTKLDEYLNSATPYGFSGVVLVAKGRKILLQKGYGFTDKRNKIANDTKTLFLIGSVSKQFTAAAILKLEMEGKLNTADSINKYLDNVPPDKKNITIHELLTHTSGLPASYPNLSDSPAMNIKEGVARSLNTPLILPVGSEYSYSNIGYLLLAGVVEKVSKQPFREYLRRSLFQSAGMLSTSFAGEVSRHQNKRIARGYNRSIDWGLPDTRPVRKTAFGFGDIISTVTDLYKWQLALKEGHVLSAAAKAKLFAPSVKVEKGVDYGYGWNISRTPRNTILISHGGDASPEGWTADFRWYPDDEDVVVIILANEMRDTWGLVHPVKEAVERIIFKNSSENFPSSISLPRKTLGRYAGIYRLPSGAKFLIHRENDYLTIAAEGQEAVNLLLGNPDKKSTDLFGNLNTRTAAIVEGISEDNYLPLRDALDAIGVKLTIEKAKERYGVRWVNWRSLVEKYGRFNNYEALGTVPAYDGMFTTHIRLNFERSSIVYRWYWWRRGLERIYADEYLPAANPLVPQSRENFTTVDLIMNIRTPVHFDFNQDGSVAGLSFVSNSPRIKALKEF